MIMRATQKKMMSGPVTSVLVGIEGVEARLLHRRGIGPAQRREGPEPGRGPGVEDVVLLHPVLAGPAGPSRETCTFVGILRGPPRVRLSRSRPLRYQTGMRWPHQSWRLMHQSWMFSSQWR